jgi:nucleotide-binding universal stress UspA family protein
MKRFPPESILAPTDLSEISLVALGYARLFHERFGSKVTVLHAEEIEAPPYFTKAQTAALLRAAADARREAAVEVSRVVSPVLGFEPTVRVVEGYPAAVIGEVADLDGHDLIVLGTHGRRGVSRFFLAEKLLQTSETAVLVARRPPAPEGCRNIVSVLDESAAARDVLAYAHALSESFAAELHLLRDANDAEIEAKSQEVAADLVVLGRNETELTRRLSSPLLYVPAGFFEARPKDPDSPKARAHREPHASPRG